MRTASPASSLRKGVAAEQHRPQAQDLGFPRPDAQPAAVASNPKNRRNVWENVAALIDRAADGRTFRLIGVGVADIEAAARADPTDLFSFGTGQNEVKRGDLAALAGRRERPASGRQWRGTRAHPQSRSPHPFAMPRAWPYTEDGARKDAGAGMIRSDDRILTTHVGEFTA